MYALVGQRQDAHQLALLDHVQRACQDHWGRHVVPEGVHRSGRRIEDGSS